MWKVECGRLKVTGINPLLTKTIREEKLNKNPNKLLADKLGKEIIIN